MSLVLVIEQKPSISWSETWWQRTGKGWLCNYFEGPCLHKTWDAARQCVIDYYKADQLAALITETQTGMIQ